MVLIERTPTPPPLMHSLIVLLIIQTIPRVPFVHKGIDTNHSAA